MAWCRTSSLGASAPTTQEAAQGFDFDEAKYRLRGIVEGIFGSGEVRHGNKTRCRLRMSRAKDVLLRVLGFNLGAYMKAKVALSTAANYLFPRILKQPGASKSLYISNTLGV
jgi:hypothetical protein